MNLHIDNPFLANNNATRFISTDNHEAFALHIERWTVLINIQNITCPSMPQLHHSTFWYQLIGDGIVYWLTQSHCLNEIILIIFNNFKVFYLF